MTSKSGFSRYDQNGRLTDDPTPPLGCRTDCSQWIRAVYLQAGAHDPGLNTWEQAAKGTRTNRPRPGDLMLVADKEHVELYVGEGKTIGHGSPPIDEGPPLSYWNSRGGHFFVTFDWLDDKPSPRVQKAGGGAATYDKRTG
jgi:cell wall-associated NlpC family hydrolase